MDKPRKASKNSRLRRYARRGVKLLGWLLAVVGALLLVVSLALDMAATKRWAADKLNETLADTFQGRLIIERIGTLGWSGASGVTLRIESAQGERLLYADGLRARWQLGPLVRSALGDGPLDIRVDEVRADYIDLDVRGDEQVPLALAEALTPRAAPEPQPEQDAPVALQLPAIEVTHLWAHGAPAGLGHLDADVDALRLALALDGGDLLLSLEQVTLHTRSAPLSAQVEGTLSGRLGLRAAGLSAEAHYDGTLAGIASKLDAKLNGDALDAALHIRDASPDKMRAVIPEWPLTKPVTLQASATGTTTLLKWRTTTDLARAQIKAHGSLQLQPKLVLTARIETHKLDLRSVAQGLPASELSFEADVNGRLDKDGYPLGTVKLRLAPGRLQKWSLPAATLNARADHRGYKAELRAKAPVALEAHAQLDRARQNATLRLTASAENLRQLADNGLPIGDLQGRAEVSLWGDVKLDKQPTLKLTGELNASEVKRDPLAANHLSATVSAHGRWPNPRIELSAHGVGMNIAGQLLKDVQVALDGTPEHGQLRATIIGKTLGQVRLSGDVHVLDDVADRKGPEGLALRVVTPRLVWSRDGRELSFQAARLALIRDRMVLEKGRIEGLGEPLLVDATLQGQHLQARLQSKRIELASVAYLADVPGKFTGGGSIDVTVNGSATAISADIEQEGLGHMKLRAPAMRLAGSALDPLAWRDAAGTTTLSGEISLDDLSRRLADQQLKLDAGGTLAWTLTAERQRIRALPSVSADIKLNQGAVAGYEQLFAAINGTLRNGTAGVQAHIGFGKQRVATLAGQLELPPERRTLDDLIKLPSWKQARLLASLWLQPTAIKTLLPKDQQAQAIDGELELLCNLSGTLAEPRMALDGQGRHLRVPGLSVPLQAHLRGDYDGRRARITVTGNAGGRPIAVATATAPLSTTALWARQFDNVTLGVQGGVRGLPAQWLTALREQRMGGVLSASFALDDYRHDAALVARGLIEHLSIGGAPQGQAELQLHARNKKLQLLVDVNSGAGALGVDANGPMQWGAALTPSIDRENLELSIIAKRFRLSAVAPLLSRTVKLLDGTLNGRLTLRPGKAGPRVAGDMLWTGGKLQLRGFGERFEPILARVTADGRGNVKLRRFEAKSLGGAISASGSARLSGLNVESAKATLLIDEDEPFPLVLDGVSQGHVSGRFELTARRPQRGDPLDMQLSIPELHAELPRRNRRDLQQLDAPKHIRIGRRGAGGEQVILFPLTRRSPRLASTTKTPTSRPPRLRLTLGNEVELRQGDLLRVQLGGSVMFELGEPLRASGAIRLTGGTLDVKGKDFTIQRGTVTFSENIKNPQINVTAAWTAANGTVVYADYVGPADRGKLTLRSQPSLRRGEILALLLFGTSDRNLNAGPGTSAAASLAGDVATQPLNQALRDVTGLDIATRIDTTRSDNPAPEVELRIARNLSLQFTHILGLPTPGENPDRNLTTLVWRFLGNWSIETTVGDQGSSVLDLFWRYSY